MEVGLNGTKRSQAKKLYLSYQKQKFQPLDLPGSLDDDLWQDENEWDEVLWVAKDD